MEDSHAHGRPLASSPRPVVDDGCRCTAPQRLHPRGCTPEDETGGGATIEDEGHGLPPWWEKSQAARSRVFDRNSDLGMAAFVSKAHANFVTGYTGAR